MKITIILALVAGLFLNEAAHAQRARLAIVTKSNNWTLLGTKQVNWRLDKDVMRVGWDEGTFSKLRVTVTGGTVDIRKMVVTYGNGSKETIRLKHRFRRGDSSRVIDLKGNKRVIKNITFVYDRKNIARKAQVRVTGRN